VNAGEGVYIGVVALEPNTPPMTLIAAGTDRSIVEFGVMKYLAARYGEGGVTVDDDDRDDGWSSYTHEVNRDISHICDAVIHRIEAGETAHFDDALPFARLARQREHAQRT
jgi:hypothetical protein